MVAAGVLDGHGAGADELELLELFPDPDERERVLQIAAKVMAHPEFVAVRDAIRRRLQFRDELTSAEIGRIATDAAMRRVGIAG